MDSVTVYTYLTKSSNICCRLLSSSSSPPSLLVLVHNGDSKQLNVLAEISDSGNIQPPSVDAQHLDHYGINMRPAASRSSIRPAFQVLFTDVRPRP